MAQTYRVVYAHAPEPADPLFLKKGEVVSFERKNTEWDGWLWCSRPTGESGWLPESWVKIQGDTCVLERDYNAFELTVQPNDLLDGILTESGWLLAISTKGSAGWVPLSCVELTTTGHPIR